MVTGGGTGGRMPDFTLPMGNQAAYSLSGDPRPTEGAGHGKSMAGDPGLRVGGASLHGIPASDVQELVRIVTITPPPPGSGMVEGVINLRGSVIPVFDLRAWLGLPGEGGGRVGIAGDRAEGGASLAFSLSTAPWSWRRSVMGTSRRRGWASRPGRAGPEAWPSCPRGWPSCWTSTPSWPPTAPNREARSGREVVPSRPA